MYKRKVEDAKRVKRLWWVKPEYRRFFEKNRKQCSCWMCGNPRRRGELPLQELRWNLAHRDEISEYISARNVNKL